MKLVSLHGLAFILSLFVASSTTLAQERNVADKSLKNPSLYFFFVQNYGQLAGLQLTQEQQQLFDAQKQLLNARNSQYRRQCEELDFDSDLVISTGIRDIFLEDGREIVAKFDGVLTVEQRQRLEQIAFQYQAHDDFQSPSMLQSKFVHEKLNLARSQQQKLISLGKASQKSIDKETELLLKRIREIQAKAQQQADAQLSKEQSRAHKELLGPTLDFHPLRTLAKLIGDNVQHLARQEKQKEGQK